MRQESSTEGPYCIVFSGHRIDAPDRPTPRFPASSEAAAAEMIDAAVQAEIERVGGENLRGIASCANGGDILFLEACAAHGVPATIFLALPRDEFVAASVADGGNHWVERFERLIDRMLVQVLERDEESPMNVYEQTNLWMLNQALSNNAAGVAVMVLWDGGGGDGAGGTMDMVRRAGRAGARVVHLDTNELL